MLEPGYPTREDPGEGPPLVDITEVSPSSYH